MILAEVALYRLARAFSTTELAHSNEMKSALSDAACCDRYRSAEVARVLTAARRFGIAIAGADVLDLGCNDGALTSQYLHEGPRSVAGVDVDADAIARARRAHGDRIAFHVGTPATIPVPDASFDTILCYDVFEHVAQPDAILAECRRALRPGGRMLIGTWGWYHPFAPHLWSTMPVPWAHVAVSERTLLRACRRVYHSPWYSPTYHDFSADGTRKPDRYTEEAIPTDYLNKYLVRDFERAFASSGMRWALTLDPFGSARWTAPLLRVPVLREFIHGYLWATLEKTAP